MSELEELKRLLSIKDAALNEASLSLRKASSQIAARGNKTISRLIMDASNDALEVANMKVGDSYGI